MSNFVNIRSIYAHFSVQRKDIQQNSDKYEIIRGPGICKREEMIINNGKRMIRKLRKRLSKKLERIRKGRYTWILVANRLFTVSLSMWEREGKQYTIEKATLLR